jgi:hypothetical protein
MSLKFQHNQPWTGFDGNQDINLLHHFRRLVIAQVVHSPAITQASVCFLWFHDVIVFLYLCFCASIVPVIFLFVFSLVGNSFVAYLFPLLIFGGFGIFCQLAASIAPKTLVHIPATS